MTSLYMSCDHNEAIIIINIISNKIIVVEGTIKKLLKDEMSA